MRLLGLAAIAGFGAFAIAFLGMRMLAPYYGLTPFLVSTVTVVALGALSLAQLLGARASVGLGSVAVPILLAACWTMAMPWVRTPLLTALDPLGLRVAMVLAATILIGPPLLANGMALPVATRLGAPTLDHAARAASRALAGALAGALLAAVLVPVVLLPGLGMRRAAVAVALVELAGAALAFGPGRVVVVTALAAVIGLGLAANGRWASAREPRWGLEEVRDGRAAELRVLDKNGVRYLLADGTVHTVVATDEDAPLMRSTTALELLKLLAPRPGPGTPVSRGFDVLVLGMRGGTVARAFARDGWRVHVVEPDPEASRMAAQWLRLRPEDARVTTSDPRVFLRTHAESYPVIILDSFADSAIPVHLVTAEFFELVASRLRPDGVVAVSIETQGWDDPFLRSLAATLRRRFRVVRALPTSEPPNALGSIVVLASNRSLDIPDERLPDPTNFHSDPEGLWVVQQTNHAWLNRYEPEARHARVLTDEGPSVDLWSERLNAATRRELHALFGRDGRSW